MSSHFEFFFCGRWRKQLLILSDQTLLSIPPPHTHIHTLYLAIFLQLASGLLENSSLKVLNLSWNALGSSVSFSLLGEAISRHSKLEHVDVSHNNIEADDMFTFSNDMDKNHSVLGIHMEGNRGSVDTLGFMLAGQAPPALSSESAAAADSKAKKSRAVVGAEGEEGVSATGQKKKKKKKKKGGDNHTITKKRPVVAATKKKTTMKRPPKRKPGSTKWKQKKNKTHERTVINQVLHALYMLWMESGMKPEQIFQTMDADSDGLVTAREFRDGLKKLGLNIDTSDASIVFMEMDRDNSGELEYKEL